jgi:DNA-binding NtrC family response regulator
MVENKTEPRRIPKTLKDLVLAYERVVIIEALARCSGSCTKAAAALGVRRTHLYRRIRACGVNLREVQESIAAASRGRGPS